MIIPEPTVNRKFLEKLETHNFNLCKPYVDALFAIKVDANDLNERT